MAKRSLKSNFCSAINFDDFRHVAKQRANKLRKKIDTFRNKPDNEEKIEENVTYMNIDTNDQQENETKSEAIEEQQISDQKQSIHDLYQDTEFDQLATNEHASIEDKQVCLNRIFKQVSK